MKPGKNWLPLICKCGQQVGWYNPRMIVRSAMTATCTNCNDSNAALLAALHALENRVYVLEQRRKDITEFMYNDDSGIPTAPFTPKAVRNLAGEPRPTKR